jgi:hypothetical protein
VFQSLLGIIERLNPPSTPNPETASVSIPARDYRAFKPKLIAAPPFTCLVSIPARDYRAFKPLAARK